MQIISRIRTQKGIDCAYQSEQEVMVSVSRKSGICCKALTIGHEALTK